MPAIDRTPPEYREGVRQLLAGNGAEAVALLEPLSLRFPRQLDLWDHLAAALTLEGKCELAEAAFQKAFALGADFPETWHNAARNAQRWGRGDLQLVYARHMLDGQQTTRCEGLLQTADALRRQGRVVEAHAACRQLMSEQSDEPGVARAVARVLIELRQPDEALEICDTALQTNPDHPGLQITKVEALMAKGDLSGGIAFANYLIARQADNLDALSALCFYYQYLPEMSVAARKQHAQRYGALVSQQVRPFTTWDNPPTPNRPLKLGFISGDLRDHPIAYFTRSWLEHLSTESHQVTVYDTLDKADDITRQIRSVVKQWHVVKELSNDQLIELIRADGIDILIDLHGHTTGHRLVAMAHRPAPVQLTYTGYLGTTGVPGIDYVLADPYCIPADATPTAEDEFTETVWRLPGSYYCFSAHEKSFELGPLPALHHGFITFACLNKPDKINDHVLKLWGKLIAAVPNSRLVLRGALFGIPSFREQFKSRMALCGLDHGRVTLLTPAPPGQYLTIYRWIDIALDTFPYAGGTTTAEALWSGVPVLAMKGDRMIWRMANSILHYAGMDDWVAEDADDYIRIGQAKAADLNALAALRERQRLQILDSPLLDASAFARRFEEAVRGMWRRWCERIVSSNGK
jgi:protein O-GlcNAc transferase